MAAASGELMMNIPGRVIDTDEVRATVRKLTDALYDYDFAEQLAKVVEDRDALRRELKSLEEHISFLQKRVEESRG